MRKFVAFFVLLLMTGCGTKLTDSHLLSHHRSRDELELRLLVDSTGRPVHGVFVGTNYQLEPPKRPKFAYVVRQGEVELDGKVMSTPQKFTLYVNDAAGNLHTVVLNENERAIFMKSFDINNQPFYYASDLWDKYVEGDLKPGERHNKPDSGGNDP